MKIKQIIALLLCVCLLSSCTFEFNTEELLMPPTLTETQKSINEAIFKSVGSNNYRLIYPQNGVHLASCTLFDLDGDGNEEAIVFYELSTAEVTSTWMSVLKAENGQWKTIKQIAGQGSSVDRLDFAKLIDENEYCILVGWSDHGSKSSECYIYTYEENDVNKLDDHFVYNELLVSNLNQDLKDEIILCNFISTQNQEASISLIQSTENGVTQSSIIPISSRIKEIVSFTSGQFSQGLKAIFMDVELSNKVYDTIIVAVNDDNFLLKLENITINEISDFYTLERTSKHAVCRDFDGDGLIDIPYLTELPGYEHYEAQDTINLTTYYSLKEGRIVDVGRCVVNDEDGYILKFDPAWSDRVTVYNDRIRDEWVLKYYNGTIEAENPNEILAIYAHNRADYTDIFENYVLLASRGNTEYFCRLPSAAILGYELTADEVTNLFLLT